MPIEAEFPLSLQTQNSFDVIKRSINSLNYANMELSRHMESLKSPWRGFSNFVCREQVLSLTVYQNMLSVPVGAARPKDAFSAAN